MPLAQGRIQMNARSMSEVRRNALCWLINSSLYAEDGPRRAEMIVKVQRLVNHILLKERKYGWQEGAEWQVLWGDPHRPGYPHPRLAEQEKPTDTW